MASTQPVPKESEDKTNDLIPLTRNEIRRIFTTLIIIPPPAQFKMRWSRWRRRH